MRVGLVCPYDWYVPGGVRSHVRDLAEVLIARGHDVSVLAAGPTDEDETREPYLQLVGRAVPVPYNGAVARLSFGPRALLRTRAWLTAGRFDVLHVHEPTAPSLSMLALWAADIPAVATFHSSNERSRSLSAAAALMRPAMEKISARIAVSEAARSSAVIHVGGEPVIIPNGVDTAAFANAEVRASWREPGPTIAFLGRIDEPRKGFGVALEVTRLLRRDQPSARLLAAGPAHDPASVVPDDLRDAVTLLGYVDDADRAALLASATVYLAPHLGGESFGIVLVEAMAAGAAVVASDLPGFRAVLQRGGGVMFPVGDASAAARLVCELVNDPHRRAQLATRGRAAAAHYDWSRVIADIEAVYATVTGGGVRS